MKTKNGDNAQSQVMETGVVTDDEEKGRREMVTRNCHEKFSRNNNQMKVANKMRRRRYGDKGNASKRWRQRRKDEELAMKTRRLRYGAQNLR